MSTGEHQGARAQKLRRLAGAGRFPVVIIGAGINGVGVFHDLSLQGVDCLIVDKGDFCSGASAALSRMIHGGLKYCETGEFRLVSESVRERNRLLRNAPHLVTPLETLIPIEHALGGEFRALARFLRLSSRPARRSWSVIKLGLSLYDFYSRGTQVMPDHRMLSGRALRGRMPGLDTRFRYGAAYFDAQISAPERLGVELIKDAEAANPGSLALNHCALEMTEAGELLLKDQLSPARATVAADLVINAAGPWIDGVNGRLGLARRLIAGARGSHIMLDLPALRDLLRGVMLYFDPGDGRICIVTELSGRVMLGTTDLRSDDPDGAVCTDEEVDYLFAALTSLFPGLQLGREHIVYSYSGLRPLPAGDDGSSGLVSRDHHVDIAEAEGARGFPVFSLIGGKWTTYRAFGEQVADMALERLGRARRASTAEAPIGGGEGFAPGLPPHTALIDEIARATGGDRAAAATLVRRYGTAARAVVQAGEMTPLDGAPQVMRGEIAYLCREEMPETLTDLALRRLNLGIAGQLDLKTAEALCAEMGALRGWPPARQRAEMDALAAHLRQRHRIDLATGRFVEQP